MTTEYYVYAYNAAQQKWSHALPIVISSSQSPVKAEILSHEITADHQIKLSWSSAIAASQFVIFCNGIPVSSNDINNNSWTDRHPREKNQYVLYVGYLDHEGRTHWTWSSPYVVQKPTSTPSAAQSAKTLDAFWADYGFDLVEDDILNAIA
jgi:hypothetical protein